MQGVTGGYKGLLEITRGYKELQGVTGVTKGYKELLGITKCYKGLH